jgi:hypothetical protein
METARSSESLVKFYESVGIHTTHCHRCENLGSDTKRAYSSSMKTGVEHSSQTSVNIYQTIRHYILHIHRRNTWKSHNLNTRRDAEHQPRFPVCTCVCTCCITEAKRRNRKSRTFSCASSFRVWTDGDLHINCTYFWSQQICIRGAVSSSHPIFTSLHTNSWQDELHPAVVNSLSVLACST